MLASRELHNGRTVQLHAELQPHPPPASWPLETIKHVGCVLGTAGQTTNAERLKSDRATEPQKLQFQQSQAFLKERKTAYAKTCWIAFTTDK